MKRVLGLRGLGMLMFGAVLLLGTGAAVAQTFSPIDTAADEWSRILHNKIARTVVFLGMAAVGLTVVLLRGHGIEIFVTAFIIVVGLLFMLGGADYIFELAGYADI